MSKRISRRTVLKGLLGGAVVGIGLPPLEMFFNGNGDVYADEASGFPRRFGLFFWGNGNLPERWTPKGTGTDWELSDALQPLAALKSEITVVTGTKLGVPNAEPHTSGAAGILSGAPLLNNAGNQTFLLPTIDQVIAAQLGKLTRFKSLEYGAEPKGGLSYNGPNSQNPPEDSPHKLFERIFGAGFTLPGEEPIIDPSLGLRRSVLDAVLEDIKGLKTRVGTADIKRLDQHFEGIRSLEKRLAKLEDDPPNLKACSMPGTPELLYPKIEGRPQLAAKNAAFAELSALALACDQTRVVSNWFSHPVTNTLFKGAKAGHHQLTHDEPPPQPEVHKIVVQIIEAFAAQIAALAKIDEGAGTLLDSCAFLCTSDVSYGKIHSLEDMPIIIAGSAGGRLKKGIHYASPSSENSSKVLLSICRAVGLNLASFGAEGGEVTDGLSAIEV